MGILVLVSLVLISLSFRSDGGGPLDGAQSAAATALRPFAIGFERIARATAVPVYAIGGLDLESLALAMARGAHGVALLSAAWRPGQCFGVAAAVGGASSVSSAGPPGTT